MMAVRHVRGSLLKIPRLLGRRWRLTVVLGGLASVLASQSRAQAPVGRYEVSAGLVTDTQTGLVWQQTDTGSTYTFAAAHQYCADLGGEWRVPSVKELLTLVDESRANPAVDSAVFTSIPSGGNLVSCYQTSTPLAGTGISWLVCFDAGRPTYDSATNAYRVLCVR